MPLPDLDGGDVGTSPLSGPRIASKGRISRRPVPNMSELSKDGTVQHTEDKTIPVTTNSHAIKPTFGSKFKRHCQRFWWVHLIILVIGVLVVTLLLMLVALPRIAQSEVNKAKISIVAMEILDPTPHTFELNLTTSLETHSQYHPQLDAFNASMYLENADTPFVIVEIPPVKANNDAISHINQTVQISNFGAYVNYARTVLLADEFYMIMKGRGGLKEGGLPKTDVNYNKNISMKGFNGLKDFNVTHFEILTTPLPDGSNMNGTVSIPNPTVMTIAMGNITLNLSVAGTPIGTSTLENVVLHPGSNLVPMRSNTNQTAVIGILLEPKYKSGILPVDLSGGRSVYNGQDLKYYDAALQANHLTLELNVGQALVAAGLGGLLGFGGNGTST